MSVVESDVPCHSALGKDLIERAAFRDAYRALPTPLRRTLSSRPRSNVFRRPPKCPRSRKRRQCWPRSPKPMK